MSDTLNERQHRALIQIQQLCGRIGQDHWFISAELNEAGNITLRALENRGYVIHRNFFDDENCTGFQRDLTHWQYTGKTIENELKIVRKYIDEYWLAYNGSNSSSYKYDAMFWEDREKELTSK